MKIDGGKGVAYDINDAIKRSGNVEALARVLIEDLGRALACDVKIVEGAVDEGLISFPLAVGGRLVLIGDADFDEDELGLARLLASYLSLALWSVDTQKPQSVGVRSALSALSYTELEGIVRLVDELDGMEGVVVSSKIAQKYGLGRTALLNGLRKLESAGILESRSLGTKGTFVKILNRLLITELNKYRG